MYNPDEKEIDLLREYGPDNFALCCRYKLNPYGKLTNWFTEVATEHRKTLFQSGVKCKFLRYAGVDDSRTVDVFFKQGTECKPSPLFVFIHGSDWHSGNKETSISMVGPLVKNGYRVAVVDYNSKCRMKMPEQMEQFSGFVTWIFQYADRTPTTDITFAGHGVGAHLLTHILHNPGCIPNCSRSKIKSVFLLTGYYDFREIFQLYPTDENNALGLDEQSSIDVSPILWCWKEEAQKWGCLKVHVLTVEHTSVTLQEQSRQFSQVLETSGFNSTFKQFDGLDHFTIILDQNEQKNEITKYISTAMQKASSGSSKGSNRPCTCASKR